MPSLIVIRIVPQGPIDANTFTGYLTALQITAYDLSFGSPSLGTAVTSSLPSAAYLAPSTLPSPVGGPVIDPPLGFTPTTPGYPAGTTSGIVQQYDLQPGASLGLITESPYYTLESVATAVIQVTTPPGPAFFENLRLEVTWGGTQAVPVPYEYYNVPVVNGPAPDPNAWAGLAPSLYLQIPAAPASAAGTTLALPTDGTPPAFKDLIGAVQSVLAVDPGPAQDLGQLTLAQCQNAAYEIVWAQQGPLPTPPNSDPIESLYTNPPNSGALMSGSSPNQNEGDRQQFEGNLKSYYATADATAARLTNYVYALCAAVACEKMSLAAAQVLLSFPANPGSGGTAPTSDTDIILTGFRTAMNFGVPAAYFYALGASLPTQIAPAQRYQMATGEQLAKLLSDLTAAVNTGTVTDSETGVSLGTLTTNAAQAARRLAALNVPAGSSTPLGPLGTVQFPTSGDTPSGASLPFASTAGVQPGMSVSGAGVANGTTVSSVAANASVTLGAAVSGDVPHGTAITFTPGYPADLTNLIQAWLAYPPPPAVAGQISSQLYQAGQDDTQFWPSAAAAHASGFLNLVLSALTQGYLIPAAPFASLGSEIISTLLTPLAAPPPPTVATLAAVTVAQWRNFFRNPPATTDWLPSFTAPGNTDARTATFIAYVQQLFTVAGQRPGDPINLGTSAPATGTTSLQFNNTAGISPGMQVSGPGIPPSPPAPATVVVSVSGNTVTLNTAVTVGSGATITFTPNPAAISSGGLPQLEGPSADWLTACLNAYTGGGAFTFGTAAFNLPTLQTAAGTVFPGDPAAQAWVVNALVAINNLYQILNSVPPPAAVTNAQNYEFALAEALYARGFTSAGDITELSTSEFQQALTGSVAYDLASSIYTSASAITPPPTPPAASTGGVQPVNPDGSLTNCIPPECFSPLGRMAYLHELLQLTTGSTCDRPLAAVATLPTSAATAEQSTSLPFTSTTGVTNGLWVSGPGVPAGTQVSSVVPNSSVVLSAGVTAPLAAGTEIRFTTLEPLGSILVGRRGPLGDLLATCANCETPLPLIDIVNECLEFMGAAAGTNGAIYNTSGDVLSGHKLCKGNHCGGDCDECGHECHPPATLFAALPEYSTPGTPVPANALVEPAVFLKLETDFSSCCLPYSQALDVNRTYLRHFRTCRYELMRTFHKCITEFVLDPDNVPAGFQSHLWRYPVRVDIAIEYLGLSPDEYVTLFGGIWPSSCGPAQDRGDAGKGRTFQPAQLLTWQLYGFAAGDAATAWMQTASRLPEFLERTCLTYCEFLELWKCGFVTFANGADTTNDERTGGLFPDCEPCCLEKLWILFPGRDGQESGLQQLAIFIRLWRKLRDLCGARYSLAQLRDICDVLHLFNSGTLNQHFIRQLAAFQILRDRFGLPLSDPADKPAPGAVDADRTQLLALWAGGSPAKWPWAVEQMLEGVARFARCWHKCEHRPPEFLKFLACNLDSLSQLAGFDPASSAHTDDRWQALPTHTLRFAEVLAKIYASSFRVDDLRYLFTAAAPGPGDWPFPLQDPDEAVAFPLNLPDEEHEHALWKLRHQLLEARVSDEAAAGWSWSRVETSLREEFGYAAADVLSLGRHFFPGTLQAAGFLVDAQQRRYSSPLAANQTTPGMWGTPPGLPFQYDPAAPPSGALWTQVPLSDAGVIDQLERLSQLASPAEQQAVQDLYFQPRSTLAPFAWLFADFLFAQAHLIEEREESQRWHYFQRQFALAHVRCHIVAEHLAHHVEAAFGRRCEGSPRAAFRLLRDLLADENWAEKDWENDPGTVPPVTWTPPNGGAFAALLGLTGTGLLREYTPAGGAVAWRDVSGPLSSFGRENDRHNCPVPSVIPFLGLGPAGTPAVTIRNGLAADTATGAWLGGAQGFTVQWTGALLVDKSGPYEFRGGAPAPDCEPPSLEASEGRQWRVTLKRGLKTWLVLNHHWAGETGLATPCVPLKGGAYDVCVDFLQPAPVFSSAKPARQHTGFQVKYSGPDTHERLIEVPHHRLFRVLKDLKREGRDGDKASGGWQDLGFGLTGLAPGATSFLGLHYTSSLRDIRRTYQRAFKALLFAHRFGLSAERVGDRQSELGCFLTHAHKFAGTSYYRSGAGFTQHAADFDFNFLPLLDDYYPPTAAQDSRVQPSVQRTQAMFDWWERVFDYDCVRQATRNECGQHLWHLFAEADQTHPTNPGPLLRHLCAESSHWPLDLRYYQDQFNTPYEVTSADLTDERWAIRAWHADRWLSALQRFFTVKDLAQARPDLWSSLAPDLLVAGETVTGNANLSRFLGDGCIENGSPRRYEELQRLNDGLRERGRCALVAYLCNGNRVALPWGNFATSARDLSGLLLLDVESGVCEKASRIDEAITAAQNYIRRARLGLESGWSVTHEFARMWDREYGNFRVWQACRRRRLYKENYLEWDELEKARRVEAFRLLETELRGSALSVAVPGGLEWWPNQRPPAQCGLEPLQKFEPSTTQLLSTPREGLNLIGTPQYAAQPSWLAAVVPASGAPPGNANPAGGSTSQPLPYWMKAAIRLGTRFYRVAAAGVPPAGGGFAPPRHADEKGCVDCCGECGCRHPAGVDEYYFWLVPGCLYEPPAPPAGVSGAAPDDYQYGYQDDYYDSDQQQSAFWDDTQKLPQLLEWPSQPMVRLAWCRVHNREFQQPRRSVKGVVVQSAKDADLVFQGRGTDSLTFSVTNPAVATVPGYLDPTAPGFRYDLATDEAVVLPLVTAAPAPGGPFPGGLPSYPYFVYVGPGKHLFPLSPFGPALAVARALRSHCRFEAALRWYELAFNPLTQDCTWVRCPQAAQPPTPPGKNSPIPGVVTESVAPPAPAVPTTTCCDSTDVSCAVARNRSILLHYLETLRDWGKAVMRGDSPEACQHARLVFDTIGSILGKRPIDLLLPEPAVFETIWGFKPYSAPLNPRLLDLYDMVRDQLGLIHAWMDSHRLRLARPRCDLKFFGDDPLREGWRTCHDGCAEERDWCSPHSPYRFVFLAQRAQEFAGKLRELGGALLTAYEKGDAEYLAAFRAQCEREIATLGLRMRQDQWRDADWQVEALQKGKAVNQANLAYYNGLIQAGLNNQEIQYQDLTITSTVLRAAANISEGIAAAMAPVPNSFMGVAGFGGTPYIHEQLPIGTPLAEVFSIAARISNGLAEIATSTAGLQLTEAGWTRRNQDWVHQTQILAIEIEQAEQQIVGAHRRRDSALRELNIQERQREQATEVENFLRDKFTAHELYLYLQEQTAALFFQMRDLTIRAFRQAECALNLECGHTTRRFLPEGLCGPLREQLLAGERLELAVRQMEKAYADLNVREHELTKHISLRLHFPLEFLRLRLTGRCEIELPEWLFDLDYPGLYLRRIKNVSLTIPCVAGPYNGVHCRLTLLSSSTRIDPRLGVPTVRCCSECQCESGYEACPHDPRVVRQFAVREAIATSTGQNDSGLFELNFHDDRYLPFEFQGAVSRWRIELPPENNYFDLDTLTDFIVHLNYTAREGGERLREAANRVAQRHLPGSGWTFFDVRHEFPDSWEVFRSSGQDHHRAGHLNLGLGRSLFPFIPGHRELWIDQLVLLFAAGETPGSECGHCAECACAEDRPIARHRLAFASGGDQCGGGHRGTEIGFDCVATEEWPHLYCGGVETPLGPIVGFGRHHEARFRFPADLCDVRQVFLFCHYRVKREGDCECAETGHRPVAAHPTHSAR